MAGEHAGSVRDETRRLIGEAFDRVGRAVGDIGCVPDCGCPLCRAVTAARTPDPAVVDRVATVIGDAAVGVADLLRTVTGPGRRPDSDDRADTARQGPQGADRHQKGDSACH